MSASHFKSVIDLPEIIHQIYINSFDSLIKFPKYHKDHNINHIY